MKTIEVYNDGRMLNVKAYDNNDIYVVKNNVNDIINTLQNRTLHDIRYENNDISFISSDVSFIIRNYRTLKNTQFFKELNNNIIRHYQKQKLKNKRKYTFRRVGAVAILSLSASASFLLFNGNDVNAQEYVKLDNTPSISVDTTVFDNTLTDKDVSTINLDNNTETIVSTPVDIYPQNNDLRELLQIDYDDRSDQPNMAFVISEYGELISKYANMYGLDANLMMAVATQERGEHSKEIDAGGGVGLMQVQYNVWIGNSISAYNYLTGEVDTIEVNDNNVRDLETNIRMGCMIMQNNLNLVRGNPLVALQSYNTGYSNVLKFMEQYAYDTNRSVDDVLNDYDDIGWITAYDNKYRAMIKAGDNNYVEHVLSYLGSECDLSLNYKGEIKTVSVSNAKESIRS